MLKVAGEELQTKAMDHHGLVAAVCKDLKIAERIDKHIGKIDKQRIVSPGQAVVAMILNGLGFTNRRLYLTHQFFETKPIERLLDAPIKAEDLTDYTLGHALDEIAAYGASKLFGEVAFGVALENNLLGNLNHLDTTSLSVHGDYEVEDNATVIEITHGYSKDHRPDLKQAVLSLIVNGPSAMPLWMEPLDGNSSDKKNFHETIKNVREFQHQIDVEKNFKWIADSALYNQDQLLKQADYLWLTRVPETIKEARALVERPSEKIEWQKQDKGYATSSFISNYGGMKQRWLLVFSEQAYQREQKTLERKLEQQEELLKKALWHLSNERFECEADARSALQKLQKKYNFFEIKSKTISIKKYAKRGKPGEGDERTIVGYQIEGRCKRNSKKVEETLSRKGRFILATNDLDIANYTDQQMLKEYKEQQQVEHGFRFLKDPWFMVDSIFLKSPHRIEALMMVMTLCLMVYNVAQYKLREALKEKNETLPNQLEKEVQNPTMRWIFQIMEGVGIVHFYKNNIHKPFKEMITNLNDLRKKIIYLFGETACRMYGLIQKNCPEGLGM